MHAGTDESGVPLGRLSSFAFVSFCLVLIETGWGTNGKIRREATLKMTVLLFDLSP